MLIGRFLFLLPLLAAAGSLAAKKRIPVTSGTLPTHGGLFVGLLVGTVVIVGALTFFPALSLGPIVEHFLMHQGSTFSLVFCQSWQVPMAVTLPIRPCTAAVQPPDDVDLAAADASSRTLGRCSIRRSCRARCASHSSS